MGCWMLLFRVSDSGGIGWSLAFNVSKFPSDVAAAPAAGPGTTL